MKAKTDHELIDELIKENKALDNALKEKEIFIKEDFEKIHELQLSVKTGNKIIGVFAVVIVLLLIFY